MQARVKGSDLIGTLDAIASAKFIVNFTIDRGKLHLETFDPIIVTLSIPIIDLEQQYSGDAYSSISVEVNQAYQILTANDNIDIIISKDQLLMKATGFNCRFKSVYEDRFKMPTDFQTEFNNLDSGDSLENVVRISQYLSSFAQTIKTEEPVINIKSGNAYLISNSVAIKTKLHFPDSVWIKNVLRAINATLSKCNVVSPTLKINNKSGVYGVIDFGTDSAMAFNMRFSNNTQLDAIDSVLSSVTHVADIRLSDMSSSIKIINKIYKRAEIKLIFNKSSYYVNMRIGTDNELSFGDLIQDDKNYIMDISMPMLVLLLNVYKSSSIVSVSIKERYIMFNDGVNQVLTIGLV